MNGSFEFGKGSRLGNQIFQIGLLYSIRQKRGHDFFIPRGDEQFWKCFDVSLNEGRHHCPHKFHEHKPTVVYEPNVYNQHNGTMFYGYYQSYKYYDNCKNEFVNFLKFKNEHMDFAQQKYEEFKSKYNLPIANIHYRRTDYLGNSENAWGNLHTEGYYTKADESITNDCVYIVFSDDINWCKENTKFNKNVEYCDWDEYKTLAFMTLCDINIIANSTFSWWGAFMNKKNPRVISPGTWYGPKMTSNGYNGYDDIVLPSWDKIPVFKRR